MASSSPTYINGHLQNLPKEEEIPHSTPIFGSIIHRTPSFSSSSRSHSWDSLFGSSPFSEKCPLFSPSTPLKSEGIPFSWEQIPGIPKQQGSKKKAYSDELLPLPPAGTSNSSTKKLQNQDEISPKKYHHTSNKFQRDPFFAALVECSKDDHDNDHGTNYGSSKIARTLSDRFGFISMYTSCKRTSTVSESIVYLPRRRPHYLLHLRRSS
ncbi:hypothetical protein ACJIZ3_003020 [Penstemon smallii]|uniref:Uncharacterized protein n=1 Tax=Penstemon smallii TaxID=265156 RepID=A0ABD3UBF0_9LAMI